MKKMLALSFSFRTNDDPVMKQMAVEMINKSGAVATDTMNRSEDFIRFFSPGSALRLMMVGLFTDVSFFDPRFSNVAALFMMGEGITEMTQPRLFSKVDNEYSYNYFLEQSFTTDNGTNKRNGEEKEDNSNKRMKMDLALPVALPVALPLPLTDAMNAMGLIKVGHSTKTDFAFVPKSIIQPIFQTKSKETKTQSVSVITDLLPHCENLIGYEKRLETVDTAVFVKFIQAFVPPGKEILTNQDILNYPLLRIAFLNVLKKTIADKSKRNNFQWLWQLNSLCGHLLVFYLDAKDPEEQADYRSLFDLVSSLANGHKFHELRSAQKGEVFRIAVKEGETMDQNAWVSRLVHYIVQSQSLVPTKQVLSYDDHSEHTEVYGVNHSVLATGRKRWYEAGVCVMKHLITMVSLEVIHVLGYKNTVPMADVLLLLLTQVQYQKFVQKMKDLMVQNGVTVPLGRKVYLPIKKAKYLPKEAFQIESEEKQTMLRGIMERVICRFIGVHDRKLGIQKFFEELSVLIVKEPKETFVAKCADKEQQLQIAEQVRYDSLRFVLVMAEVISSLSVAVIQRNSMLFTEDVAFMEDGKAIPGEKVRWYYAGLRHYKKVKMEEMEKTKETKTMIDNLVSIAICHQQLQQLNLNGLQLIQSRQVEPTRILSGSTVILQEKDQTKERILHSTSIH